jgi:hypothetical protein
MRVAKECLPYESPKLSVIAMIAMGPSQNALTGPLSDHLE